MLETLRRRSGWWRSPVAAIVLLFVTAAYVPAAWHEEHALDKDCTVCKLDHQKLIELPVAALVAPTTVTNETAPVAVAGPAVIVELSQAPPRAPPV